MGLFFSVNVNHGFTLVNKNKLLNSIRAWEQGRSKPRDKEVLVSLVAIRKMSVGEVREKLGIASKVKKVGRRKKIVKK